MWSVWVVCTPGKSGDALIFSQWPQSSCSFYSCSACWGQMGIRCVKLCTYTLVFTRADLIVTFVLRFKCFPFSLSSRLKHSAFWTRFFFFYLENDPLKSNIKLETNKGKLGHQPASQRRTAEGWGNTSLWPQVTGRNVSQRGSAHQHPSDVEDVI